MSILRRYRLLVLAGLGFAEWLPVLAVLFLLAFGLGMCGECDEICRDQARDAGQAARAWIVFWDRG